MSWTHRSEHVSAPRGLFILALLALCAWISVSGSIEVCEQIGHLVRWAVHYTGDEIQLKKLMTEYTAQGFRRAFLHENSNMYRFEFERWRAAKEGAKPRDMSGLESLMAKMRTTA